MVSLNELSNRISVPPSVRGSVLYDGLTIPSTNIDGETIEGRISGGIETHRIGQNHEYNFVQLDLSIGDGEAVGHFHVGAYWLTTEELSFFRCRRAIKFESFIWVNRSMEGRGIGSFILRFSQEVLIPSIAFDFRYYNLLPQDVIFFRFVQDISQNGQVTYFFKKHYGDNMINFDNNMVFVVEPKPWMMP